MKARLDTDDAKAKDKLRKQWVEPVFGIIKSTMGFRNFSLCGLEKVKADWILISFAYNYRRIARLQTA